MIVLHSDLQPQFKYMNYFIYTSQHQIKMICQGVESVLMIIVLASSQRILLTTYEKKNKKSVSYLVGEQIPYMYLACIR